MNVRLLFSMLACLAVIGFTASANAEDLTLDAEKSSISFVGSKSDGKHEGGFKKFQVDAKADFEDPSRSSMNITIDTASLWSDDDRLTNHLKSPDFFDVRKHPSITFESTEIVPKEKEGEDANGIIKGDMHMLGKKVAVDVPIIAKVTDEEVEMTANFTIDRTKWGMSYGQGKVNNDVKVIVKFVLKR